MLRGRSFSFWRRVAEARVFALPGLVLLAVTLPHLDQGDFRGDAGWYSAIGLQAWRTGSLWTLWGEPGQHYFNKPPVAFWIHGLLLWLVGPSVWAARLPSVLAALGCVLVTAGVARDLAGRRAGVFSGIALALTLEFFRRSREISLDLWQTLFLLIAVWCVVRGIGWGRWRGRMGAGDEQHASSSSVGPGRAGERWFLAAGTAIGLALLTKPLVALLFFPIMAGWFVWMRQRRLIRLLGLALLVAITIAATWHLSMAYLHGREFVAQYFGAEIGKRAIGELKAGREGPVRWWFYFEKLAELYWPWMIGVVLLLVAWARGEREWMQRPRGWQAGARLALLWTVLWLLFLTIYPDRRDRYGIVLYPGLGWLAGMWLAYAPWKHMRRIERNLLRAGAPAALVLGIAMAAAPIRFQARPEPHWQELFAWLRSAREAGEDGQLWQGGIGGSQGARVYLEFGYWPQTTRNRWGDRVDGPDAGALLLYHHRGGWVPGENERELFRSSNGDLVITKLDGDWDPRER